MYHISDSQGRFELYKKRYISAWYSGYGSDLYTDRSSADIRRCEKSIKIKCHISSGEFDDIWHFYLAFSLFARIMPTQTRTSATRQRIFKADVSCRSRADNSTPKTGFEKPKTAILDTGLCANSRLHNV